MTLPMSHPDSAACDHRGPVTTALSAAELQRAAARGSLWTLAHTVVGIPIAFVANTVVARSLGAANYGHLALITLFMGVAIALTNLGVSEGVQQWGAAANARGDAPLVDDILRASLGFHALVQLPLLVIVATVLGHGETVWVQAGLLTTAALPPLLGSSSLCISIENRTATSARISMLVNFITQLTLAVTAVLSHSPLGVWAVRNLVPTLCLPLNYQLLAPHRRRVAIQARLPRHMPQGFWPFCLLTCAAGLLGLLVVSRSEIVVLQWLGEPRMVGVFALAFGVAGQLRGPVEALLAPMLPSVAGIVEVHPDLVATALRQTLSVCALFTAGILLTVPLLTVSMPVIYGPEFAASAALLPALATAALAQAMINPLLAFARAQRAGGAVLTSNALSLAVDIAVACVLVPWLGVMGAVTAALAAQVTSTLLMAGIQVRHGTLSWVRLARTAIPLLLAIPVMAVPVAAWLSGQPALAGGLYLAGLGVWLGGTRRLLSTDEVNDLRRTASALPSLLRVTVTRGLTLLEARS
jgi:O-antigen/teichoic acid export membrane protein